MALIFGVDVGTTSIGFAVIEFDDERKSGKILRLGSRIFPEARDRDCTPLNQIRRTARMMRRQLRRRKARRRFLNEMLSTAGLLPAYGSPEWIEVMAQNPIALRTQALSEPLSPSAIGRALYHLSKRRHFLGRELEESEDGDALEADASEKNSVDEKAAKDRRAQTIEALKASGYTLGQHLAQRQPHERQRGTHALRKHVSDEFEAIWSAQAEYHPALLTDELKSGLHDIIFAQKPVFWRLNTLGECRLEPGAPLAPKGGWLSAQRRMLEKLNNLEIAGGNARPLDDQERAAILVKLQGQQSMSWADVRSAIDPLFKARGESSKTIKFNLEQGRELKLLGNPVEAKLVAIFGDDWNSHPHKQAIRTAAQNRLWDADYGRIGDQRVVIKRQADRANARREKAQSFAKDFGASAEQVAALEKLSFPTGWDAFSTSAIEKLLPELEAGTKMGQLLNGPDWEAWRNETFPNRERPTGEFVNKLPSPANKDEQERIKKLRNPTVVRAK
jgi:CRISPR-associated endonuclease Csn1